MANQLYADFKKYLGQSGDAAEPATVVQFLKSKGIPTKGAEAIMAQSGGDTKGAVDTAAKPTAQAGDSAAAQPDADDTTKPVAADAAAEKSTDAAQQTAAGQSPEEIRKTKQAAAATAAQDQMAANPVTPADTPQSAEEIRKTKQAAAATAAQDQMAANPVTTSKPAGSYNNQLAGGNQTISTGAKFDPATMKNTPGTPVGDKVQGGVPSTNTATPAATPAPGSRPQGGGRVAGQLSPTPRAIKGRERTAASAGASTSSALDQFVKTQTGANPVTMKSPEPRQNPVLPKKAKATKTVQKNSIEFEFDALLEALSRGQLSKVFLAAAQDAARAGIGAGGQSGGGQSGGGQSGGGQSGGGQSGGGGFLAGLKQGYTGAGGEKQGGDVTGTLNVNQLAGLLPGVDPRLLTQAVTVIKQGKEPNRSQMAACGQAFVALIKADAATTTQVMTMLKKVSAK